MFAGETYVERLKTAIETAEAVVIGAGPGLSDSADFSCTGVQGEDAASEAFWAHWSRYIYGNRYGNTSAPVYRNLYRLVGKKEYFVITTDVDHSFQRAGFDENRIFCPRGDTGLLQCSVPCHGKTYSNETLIRRMAESQQNRRVLSSLLPRCPVCGKPMTINLDRDEKFVRDEAWYQAAERYDNFLYKYQGKRILFLELGVDYTMPEIIKYPFRRMTANNRNAVYACLNPQDSSCPMELRKRSICIQEEIGAVMGKLLTQE